MSKKWTEWLLMLVAIPFIPLLIVFIRFASAMEAAEKEHPDDEGT